MPFQPRDHVAGVNALGRDPVDAEIQAVELRDDAPQLNATCGHERLGSGQPFRSGNDQLSASCIELQAEGSGGVQ